MAHVVDDFVCETTTATGTGAVTLGGALTAHKAMAAARRLDGSVIQVGDTVPYVMWAVDGSGTATGDREAGIGTYSAGNTLARTSVRSSSNANTLVNFGAGTKYVAIGAVASQVVSEDASGAAMIPALSAEPSPQAGAVLLYGKELAPGHTALKVMRPSGVDSPIQDALAFNRLIKWQPNGTVMIATGAAVLTVSAAGTAAVPASGSAKSQITRLQYATTATAGALHTIISPTDGNAHMLRGNVLGEGGFRFVVRFALNALQAGNRGFWGIAGTRTVATNVDPATVAAPARVGLGINANTGNWQLCRSDGTTAAATDLGASFPVDTTSLMELMLFCRPHDGTSAGGISYRVRRFGTNPGTVTAEATGTLTTNIPAATTLMHPWFFVTNNATAAIVNWHFGGATLESDW